MSDPHREYEDMVNRGIGMAFIKAHSKRWFYNRMAEVWTCTEHNEVGCKPCTELAVAEDQS